MGAKKVVALFCVDFPVGGMGAGNLFVLGGGEVEQCWKGHMEVCDVSQ